MALREQLQDDLKAAMRSGDNERRDVLRQLLAAIKQVEVDSQTTLDEAGLLGVLQKQAKQRQETIADSERAGRDDLIAQERAELEIIQNYLPQMMSREDVEQLAREAIATTGVDNMKGMGQVMSVLMPQLQGRADGRMVSEVVRSLLQQR